MCVTGSTPTPSCPPRLELSPQSLGQRAPEGRQTSQGQSRWGQASKGAGGPQVQHGRLARDGAFCRARPCVLWGDAEGLTGPARD